MVARPTFIILAIWSTVTERDSYKRRTSLICFSSRLAGRPPVLPLALAASSPARVRSRIRSRSNWANDPKMLNMRVQPGVLVSIASVSERNCTPLASKLLMSSTRFCRDRPSLSSFQTTTVSPSRSRSSMWSSSGRWAFAPDATSMKIRLQPAFFECVPLQVCGLAAGADPRIPVCHACHACNSTITRQSAHLVRH